MADKKKTIIIEGKEVGLKSIVAILAQIGKDAAKTLSLKVDTASATSNLTKAGKSVDNFADVVESGQSRATKSTERFAAANRAAGKDMASLTRTSASALTIAYAEIAANVYAAAAAFNALKAGAQFDNLQRSQEQLTATVGTNFTFISKKLKEATGNALDFQRAAQYGNLARAAGLSASQITKLAEAGTKASIALGRDLGDSIDRIFRGTVKGEPEILDELGIIIRLGDASAEYAKQLGIRADKLTSVQKTQAVYNAVLKETEKFKGVSADPDAFTKLAGSIKETALQISAFISGGLSPLASFLADNKDALLALTTVLGASVLGKAIGAFGSDVATAQLRLDRMTASAIAAKAAIAKNSIIDTSRQGIAADLSSAGYKTSRTISQGIFSDLGDTSKASNSLKAVLATLNDVDAATGKYVVSAKEIPEIFAAGGKSANSFSSQVIRGLNSIGDKSSTTFGGIQNVSREVLGNIAATTKSNLDAYAAQQTELAARLSKVKNQSVAAAAATKAANDAVTQSALIQSKLIEGDYRNTYNSLKAQLVGYKTTAQQTFAFVGLQAVKLGALVSSSLGVIGLIIGAVQLLSVVADNIGATTKGADKFNSVSDSIEENLSALNKQMILVTANINNFSAALAATEASSSLLDTIATQVEDLNSALAKLEPGFLSNILDIGSSDIEESLGPLVKYLSEIGRLSEFKEALQANGLTLGNIDDTTKDVVNLQSTLKQFSPILSTAATKAADLNNTFKAIKENNTAIVGGSSDYAASLLTIDSNLIKVYDGQKNNLEIINTIQDRLNASQAEYNRLTREAGKNMEDRLSLMQRFEDFRILNKRDLGIVGPKTNAEQLAEQDRQFAAQQRASSVTGEGQALLSQAVVAGVDPQVIDSYRSFFEVLGSDPVYLKETVNAVESLGVLTKTATESNLKFTASLALAESNASLATKERAASLSIAGSVVKAYGLSLSEATAASNALQDAQGRLSVASNKLTALNAKASTPEYMKIDARNAIQGITAEVNALAVAYAKLNPQQIVFGDSIKSIADKRKELLEVIGKETTAKGKQIKQKELDLFNLEAMGIKINTLELDKQLEAETRLFEQKSRGLTEVGILQENINAQLLKSGKTQAEVLKYSDDRAKALRVISELEAKSLERSLQKVEAEKALSIELAKNAGNNKLADTSKFSANYGLAAGQQIAESIEAATKVQADLILASAQADIARTSKSEEETKVRTAEAKRTSVILARERVLRSGNLNVLTEEALTTLKKQRAEESLITKYEALSVALDSVIDAAFGINTNGKDILKGITDSLYGDFKKSLKMELETGGFLKGIGDSLGSIIPDSVKGFFASGAGKSIMGSFGGVLQSTISGYEQNGAQGALIAGAFTALGAAVGGPIGAAIGGMIGQLAAGTKYQIKDAGLRLNASQGNLSATNFKVETKEQSFFRGTKTRTTETAVDDKAAASYLRSFEAVNQSFTGALNRYAAYFEQDVRAYDAVKGTVFGETLSFKGLSLDEQQTKIQQFFQDYGDALVDYSVPGLDKMQKAGETLIDTLNRVTRVTMTADIAFKSIFNLGTGDAKNLLGSTNKEGRLDLARGMLSVVQDDLNFAYSFLNAQGLKVKATPPKEKKSFFSKFAPIILGAVLAVVLPGIGAAIGAALQGIGAATLGASVLAAGSAGTLAAAAGGIGALASGAIVSGLMSLAGAAIISSAYGALAEGIINAATGPGAETFNLGTSADNFGANLEGIQKAMKDYAKFTFTLTADQFALNLESGLFEATEERVRLFRSKGGKKNAEKLQAEYEKQINLLNEYSAVITYLTLEAAGINTGGTGIEAKAMQQLRMKYFDDVIGFFEGEDIKAKEEAFNKAISSLTQSTSSILEVVVNGVDGAINGIKASIYTIGGVFEKQKKEMLDALDFNSDLFDSLSKDIKGSSITSIKKSGWRNQKKVRYASNQKIVEDIYGSFIGNLGLSAEDQMSAYAKLSSMTAEDVAALGNLQGEIDQRTFLARFGSSLAPSKVIMAALTKAIPLIKEKFNDLNATFAAFDTFYTGLEVLVPNDGQLPSLVRFNKLFEETVATSQDPEVFAEMVKIGETISEAIKQLFEVFRGFNVEDLVGYLDNAVQVAKSFTELGSFVADEFIKGTRAGLKDTFKNAIIEDFQKNLLSPILSALTPAISAAFAGQSSGLNIQLNDQEIADTASRLDTTANLLLTLLDNPALNAALDKVGDVFANLGTKFAGLAEQSAKLTTSLNDALKEITDNLELDAYSALVKGNAFSIAEFKTRKKVKELNISGFDESIITQPFEAVVAKVRTLIASGAIGEGNLDGVIEALRGLGEMATSAREQLQKAVEDTQAAYDTVSGSIRDISLTLIKAIKPKTASDLAKSQAAIGKYLQGVYLDVEKAKSAFADARMSGDMSAAAEAAGVLQSSLVEYMNARIDGEQFLADLQKTIYDDQKKSLEDMVEISKSFGDFLKDLKYDETLSILKPSDRLQEATTDFNALKSKIFGSDISSLTADTASTLIEDARRLLDLGRQNYASGDLYTQLYNDVVGVITQLQAQVDAKSTTLEEATRAYQDNDLALQEQIRNIQLGTLYQLQNIGSYLAGNNALASSALSALIFNQPVGSIDPTQIFADIFANTNQASLFSSAAGSNFDISSVLSSVLNSVGGGINGLLTNVTGDSTGDIANTQIQQLLSSYTGFSSIGDLFPEFDTELATLLKQLNTQQVAPTGTASTPVNVTVTAPEGTNEQTIARLTELLERLEAVLGALPAAMRTAIVQQSIAGARI